MPLGFKVLGPECLVLLHNTKFIFFSLNISSFGKLCNYGSFNITSVGKPYNYGCFNITSFGKPCNYGPF
jgi:hypothetical protein